MTTSDLLLSTWDWEPSVIVGCLALAVAYLAVARRASVIRKVSFLSGVLLLFLDLVSPLDRLGDEYLLSAHVVQHFLLALVIPGLLLLGIPRYLAEAALRRRAIARVEKVLAIPTLAWFLGVGTMLVWHIPVLFNAALANDALHIFQHLSFLVTGAIFWWPIWSPLEERRLRMLGATAYLFTACTACSILGAALTFMPVGAYPAYLAPANPDNIQRLIRTEWELDPKNDQQLGGMLMWVPGCLVYLMAILTSFARWYSASEQVEVTR
jgi:putative membrane protein